MRAKPRRRHVDAFSSADISASYGAAPLSARRAIALDFGERATSGRHIARYASARIATTPPPGLRVGLWVMT